MIGRQEMTTGGIFYFKPTECQYCRLDTGGNHQWNCPCLADSMRVNNIIIEYGYPISYNFGRVFEITG